MRSLAVGCQVATLSAVSGKLENFEAAGFSISSLLIADSH